MNRLAEIVNLRYNTGVNHIKSDRALERTCHPLSTDVRGIDTMSDHTLPLFSLQPETKEIPLTQGKIAIVDAADYEWLSQWKWYAWKSPKKKTWYARRSITIKTGEYCVVAMHREILGAEPGTLVDHVDHDGLNNTRTNIRFASNQQNLSNRSMNRNNTSGYKGVCLEKVSGKWQAQIKVNGESKHLGRFDTVEAAAAAYDVAALKYHGEFACLNLEQILQLVTKPEEYERVRNQWKAGIKP